MHPGCQEFGEHFIPIMSFSPHNTLPGFTGEEADTERKRNLAGVTLLLGGSRAGTTTPSMWWQDSPLTTPKYDKGLSQCCRGINKKTK